MANENEVQGDIAKQIENSEPEKVQERLEEKEEPRQTTLGETSEESRTTDIPTQEIPPKPQPEPELKIIEINKFRLLFDSIEDAAIVTDGKKILYGNPSFEMLSGYALSELPGIRLSKIIKKGNILHKDGNKKEVRIDEVNIGENKILLLKDEQRIKELEENARVLEALERYSENAIFRVDKREKILSWNGTAMRMFKRGNFTGTKIKQIAKKGGQISQAIKKVLRTQLPEKLDVMGGSGPEAKELFEAELSIHPMGDSVICVFRDKLEELKLRELISRAEEQYEQLVNNVTDIIFIIDKKGQIEYVNYQFEKQLGHKPGTVDSMIPLIHPDDLASFLLKLNEAQESGKGFRDLEFRLKNAKKKWIYFSANAVPKKEYREVVGFSGTIRNINETKKAHDKTEQIKKSLEEKNKKLIEINRLKSEFVSNVSHDLRTPLTSIQGYSSLLNKSVLGPLNEKQTEAAGIIHKESLRLSKLINDLLDISKLEAGAITLHKRPFKLAELEDRCSCKTLAENKKLVVIWNTPETLGEINGDPDRVAQVLTNLVSNAIKFTERGSVTVNAFVKDKTTIQIDVIDTGQGIPTKELSNVFVRFYQMTGKPTIGKKKEGSGLGLAISKEIIELHGGEIWVKSDISKGSTFSFTLPRAKKIKENLELKTPENEITVEEASRLTEVGELEESEQLNPR